MIFLAAAPFLVIATALLLERLAPGPVARFLIRLQRRKAGLKDRQLLVDGINIVFSDGGDGPPLLMIHGLGADRSSFEAVAKFLTPHYRVIIPDLPGFGESGTAPDGDYGIPAQARRIAQFMTELGIATCDLAGNSMGGWIAAHFAATCPHRVRTLWLLAAAGTGEMLETEAVLAYQRSGDYLLLARDDAEFRAVLERIFHRMPYLPYCFRREGARQSAESFALHAKIFDQLLQDGEETRLEPVLPSIAAPSLLMWGDQDRVVPLPVLRRFEALLPDHRTALLPNIGHVPQMETPKTAAQLYQSFRAMIDG